MKYYAIYYISKYNYPVHINNKDFFYACKYSEKINFVDFCKNVFLEQNSIARVGDKIIFYKESPPKKFFF